MPQPDIPASFRLFVAITVPERVKARVLDVQEQLRRLLPEPAARWTKPEQLHLTLRFLGNVESARAGALTEALRGACSGFGALQLRASGIGFFPRPRSPRVAWVGVAAQEDRLRPLFSRVQEVTNAFTTEDPEKNFSGHITLARIKSVRPGEIQSLISAAADWDQLVFGEWIASEIEIIRSQLSPQGARYSTHAVIPL